MGDERQLFGLGLGHKHAVKWIIMVAGEATRGQRVGHGDGEGVEAIGGQGLGEIVGGIEFPQSLLDTDFPGRGRTHPDEGVGQANRRAGSSRQGGIIGEPPQQCMGIEQELRRLVPEVEYLEAVP